MTHPACRSDSESRTPPTHCPSTSPTRFSEAVGDYLLHLTASGRTASTLDSYGRALRWLSRSLEARDVTSITAEDLERAFLRLEEDTDVARSQTTLNRLRSTYRTFFLWAFETGRILRNPAAGLRRALAESKPTPAIRAAEVERLLGTIDSSRDRCAVRDEALFAILAFTGLRRCEVLALRVGDYDPARGTLMVSRAKGGVG